MTIQEAIRTGKYFRRASADKEEIFAIKDNCLCYVWLDYSEEPPAYSCVSPEYTGFENLDLSDILADDWEVVDEMP